MFNLKTAESEARDTEMLPELSSKCNEALLGCDPGQAARDG